MKSQQCHHVPQHVVISVDVGCCNCEIPVLGQSHAHYHSSLLGGQHRCETMATATATGSFDAPHIECQKELRRYMGSQLPLLRLSHVCDVLDKTNQELGDESGGRLRKWALESHRFLLAIAKMC